MNEAKISIIIPAYNEADNIETIVCDIKALYPDFEIIVINDGSLDDTAAEAQRAGAKVFSHPYNIGNGAAIKSGIRVATGDILVFMDGDGQHLPENIAELMAQEDIDGALIGGASLDARTFAKIINFKPGE